MSILSDDEADRMTAQMIYDIENAVDVGLAANVFNALDGRAIVAVLLRLRPALTEAVKKYAAGDRSQAVINMTSTALVVAEARKAAENE